MKLARLLSTNKKAAYGLPGITTKKSTFCCSFGVAVNTSQATAYQVESTNLDESGIYYLDP